jgi:hypothetical protein
MLGRSQLGEGGPPGVLTVLQPWRLAGTGPCTSKKKVPVLPLPPQISRGAAAGVRSNTFMLPLILAQKGIPQPAAGLSSVRRQDTGSASRADALPGFLSGLPAGFSSPICHCLEGPETPPAGAAGPAARDIASRFGDDQDPASSCQDHLAGEYRLRGKRG